MSKKKSSRHGDEKGRSARHRVSKLASAIAKRELAKARTLLASLVAEPAAAESLRSQLRAKPHRGIAEGDTLLHLAVKSGDAGLVRLLTEHGADVNAADARGRLPGHRLFGVCCPPEPAPAEAEAAALYRRAFGGDYEGLGAAPPPPSEESAWRERLAEESGRGSAEESYFEAAERGETSGGGFGWAGDSEEGGYASWSDDGGGDWFSEAELRRWHPDKFVARWGARLCPAEREAILARVTAVSQCLTQLMAG
ncbi:hypothetical protein EMIHUDRAFT_244740 [Emiliania huxleyi CCMP1516]|uniref:NF-kappa-B inhibitor-like protein 1 n=2 Tax=Emiliania huxleyi TaxID=2903 RepID=A0A0D3IZM7_EMIH1|nr:hypothetical protein EMIHUDRAFT_244740 [Emiliania huxleyi CCMP1516]EOD16712.1 hypothetical protein EMIHUDRAFT_244740 [Emiliania huxleyi CCMP1516]|eukprot:XP_005769141.1 hypothetical protein EMIHUDRAFT_244740 [Emiliania huxleyi CCMP1516]